MTLRLHNITDTEVYFSGITLPSDGLLVYLPTKTTINTLLPLSNLPAYAHAPVLPICNIVTKGQTCYIGRKRRTHVVKEVK